MSEGIIEDISNINGLTENEQIVMNHILDAWKAFQLLKMSHPDEESEFRRVIHQMQTAMGLRILRREYPKGWYSSPGWYVRSDDYPDGLRIDAKLIPNDIIEANTE